MVDRGSQCYTSFGQMSSLTVQEPLWLILQLLFDLQLLLLLLPRRLHPQRTGDEVADAHCGLRLGKSRQEPEPVLSAHLIPQAEQDRRDEGDHESMEETGGRVPDHDTAYVGSPAVSRSPLERIDRTRAPQHLVDLIEVQLLLNDHFAGVLFE